MAPKPVQWSDTMHRLQSWKGSNPMGRRIARFLFVMLIGTLTSLGPASAQLFDARSGAFPDVDRMESTFTKGTSTKADVEALLGRPNGRGGALSNLEPQRPREIWLYEELGVSLIDMKGGVARIHIAQQFLMIYFVDGIFDGFWWHDNAAPVAASTGSGG